MDEKRIHNYFDLIQKLLNCQIEEESDILLTHQYLLDADFLEMIKTAAKQAGEDGNEKTKNWLLNLQDKLNHLDIDDEVEAGEGITNLENILEGLEAHLEFLPKIIQTIAQTSSDRQVVYALLQQNTDKLDKNFISVLSYWFITTIEDVENDEAEYIVALVVELSNLIKLFTMAEEEMNMEIAIVGYELVLDAYQKLGLLFEWAMVQNNLGLAYAERIMGDQAENQEKAIAAYHDALTIRTQAQFPQDWAMTLNNLGTVYAERIMGERAENQEKAIAAYHDALKVRTKSQFPQDWAMTLNNLGTVYAERIMGDQTENQEKAIFFYNQALEVYTQDAFPLDWAMIHNNLKKSSDHNN
ncbi:tetratricopeptide repeat protein [Calothrix rhizosoleniae]|uniref:tetratricopeptide repeat protein n=1 Tax=Calothrix rhizosoleniae TaxID=888997 RepID=UPI000B49DDD0|nr:tetratricopeptide repeat protein [Calothrix rhizosoleniae]